MSDEQDKQQQDRWRELADLLGVPPEDPGCPPTVSREQVEAEQAPTKPVAPAPPPAEDLIAESARPHPQPVSAPEHEAEPLPGPTGAEPPADDKGWGSRPEESEGRRDNRGGRGRGRGRGRRDDEERGRGRRRGPRRPDEESPAPPPPLDEEELPQTTSAALDEPEDDIDLANWNVPSWTELIASLYRPER